MLEQASGRGPQHNRERRSPWSRFAEKTCDPIGETTQEQSVPEGLCLLEETHAGAVCEGLKLIGRMHIGEVHGLLSHTRERV